MKEGLKKRIFRLLEKRLGNYSLNRKITSIFAITGIVFALFSISLLVIVRWAFIHKQLQEDYKSIAGLVALNAGTAVIFGDSGDAEEELEQLAHKSEIVYSEILLDNGKTLAKYGNGSRRRDVAFANENASKISYFGATIEVIEFIGPEQNVFSGTDENANSNQQAYLYLVGNLRGVYISLLLEVGAITLIMLIGGIFVFKIASRLSHLITDPILDLAKTAQRISSYQDFSQRQNKAYDDETGQLVDAFNSMMEQIESRDDIIRANEEQFREFFELGIVGMSILDEEGHFRNANSQLAEMLASSSKEIFTSSFDDWIASDKTAITFEKMKGLCNPGYSGEHWLETSSGKQLFTIVSARRIHGTNKDYFIVLFQDITSRKRSEEELIASKQAAERANNAKDEFLSVMSHELRTPLNPIIGFSELLIEMDEDEERLDMLGSIKAAGGHLLTVINDILEFTSSQAEQAKIVSEPLNLEAFCLGVIDIVRPSANERKISINQRNLDTSVLSEQTSLLTDVGKIRQLALNLLINAVKYNKPNGTVWLDAIVSKNDSGSLFLRITVEDTGIGFSAEQQEQMFKPFTQLDMSMQRKEEGLGLGLAICKKIIDTMNGELRVSSNPGKGSVFEIILPVEITTNKSSQNIPVRLGKLRHELQEAKPHILFVEDDPSNKTLMTSILEQLGVTYDWAENGIVALEKIKTHTFDMVLMDIRMPAMSGLEATRHIRAAEAENQRIPIIAMTAHASESMEQECLSIGMDGYISKPIEFAKLENYMRRYLVQN